MNESWDELATKQYMPAEGIAADMRDIKLAAGTFAVLLSLVTESVNNVKKGTGNAIVLMCLSLVGTRHKDCFVS
jgi:hypothetical protein